MDEETQKIIDLAKSAARYSRLMMVTNATSGGRQTADLGRVTYPANQGA